jgi:ribosomal protein L36
MFDRLKLAVGKFTCERLAAQGLSVVKTSDLKALEAGRDEWMRLFSASCAARRAAVAERTKLEAKCAAICATIRRRKGRGRVTCQSDPMHNF